MWFYVVSDVPDGGWSMSTKDFYRLHIYQLSSYIEIQHLVFHLACMFFVQLVLKTFIAKLKSVTILYSKINSCTISPYCK